MLVRGARRIAAAGEKNPVFRPDVGGLRPRLQLISNLLEDGAPLQFVARERKLPDPA